jgi:hypothetical protein
MHAKSVTGLELADEDEGSVKFTIRNTAIPRLGPAVEKAVVVLLFPDKQGGAM